MVSSPAKFEFVLTDVTLIQRIENTRLPRACHQVILLGEKKLAIRVLGLWSLLTRTHLINIQPQWKRVASGAKAPPFRSGPFMRWVLETGDSRCPNTVPR